MKYFQNRKNSILFILFKTIPVFIFLMLLASSVVFATGENEDTVSTSTVQLETTINNPLGDNLKDIPSFIKEGIRIILVIGIPLLALAIMYSGYLFISAQGDPNKLKTAKNALLNTLIGALLVLGAFVISQAIVNTVEEIKSTT